MTPPPIPSPLPSNVDQARLALLAAIEADPAGCAGCERHAIALGAACRESQLPGAIAYRVLVAAVGYTPRPFHRDATVTPTTPRERLMLAAVDAFYRVARYPGSD